MPRIRVAGVLLLGAIAIADAQLVPCRTPSDAPRIAEALARLRAAVDPCGESDEVIAVLDALAGCMAARYEICASAGAARNVFDRPVERDGLRTIRWDPTLSSALEPHCDAQPDPVRREPTASLLHELVHAAHDCAGLDPGQHELEAVRIENIYRRAAGLRQRRGYGDQALPATMTRLCDADSCSCAPAAPADAAPPAAAWTVRREAPVL